MQKAHGWASCCLQGSRTDLETQQDCEAFHCHHFLSSFRGTTRFDGSRGTVGQVRLGIGAPAGLRIGLGAPAGLGIGAPAGLGIRKLG